jgi:predicted DCC family thiol-disulfide oxidoreductase YuxK
MLAQICHELAPFRIPPVHLRGGADGGMGYLGGMSWVLFFDGECGLCTRSVRWVARWDRRGRISFAPLQGALAREHDLGRFAARDGGSMVVLRENDGAVFLFSDAWLELATALGGLWRVFAIARWVPRRLRDSLYRWLARHRHQFPGRADRCALPDPEVVKRLRN